MEIFGHTRYEYIYYDNKNFKHNNAPVTRNHYANSRFVIDGNFKVKIDDYFFGLLNLEYDNYDISGRTDNWRGLNGGNAAAGASNSGWGKDNDLDVKQVFLGYMPHSSTTITAGRQSVGSFFSNNIIGTGAKITNTSITGLNLKVSAYDTLQKTASIGSGLNGGVSSKSGVKPIQNNFYDSSIIGKYGFLTLGGYFSYLENIFAMSAVDVATKFNINKDFSFGLHGQYAFNNVDGWFKDDSFSRVDDANFWGIDANTRIFGFSFKTGFVKYSAKEGKMGFSAIEDESELVNPLYEAGGNEYTTTYQQNTILTGGTVNPIIYILPTGTYTNSLNPLEDAINYTLYSGNNQYWFVGGSYSFSGKFSIGHTYTRTTNKEPSYFYNYLPLQGTNNKIQSHNYLTNLAYSHNKKINFSAYWSYTDKKYIGDGYVMPTINKKEIVCKDMASQPDIIFRL